MEKNQIFKKIYIVVKTEREKLYSRINQDVKMINLGVLEEVNLF